MSDTGTLERVTALVAPIVADLKLDLYDVEFRGGTLRITIDTPPGSGRGVDLESISLVTRLVSRDLDHHDPVPGRYTLEVTSPGLERSLRTPAHFRREVGKTVAIRLRDTTNGERRLQGVLAAAGDDAVTIRTGSDDASERTIAYAQIDRARTVFEWTAAPKPGKGSGKGRAKAAARTAPAAAGATDRTPAGATPTDDTTTEGGPEAP